MLRVVLNYNSLSKLEIVLSDTLPYVLLYRCFLVPSICVSVSAFCLISSSTVFVFEEIPHLPPPPHLRTGFSANLVLLQINLHHSALRNPSLNLANSFLTKMKCLLPKLDTNLGGKEDILGRQLVAHLSSF